MCYRPLHINLSLKNSYYHKDYLVPRSVEVPCGCCSECVSKMQNDYFVRCHSEYKDCVNNGGLVVFLTFTYRESDLSCYQYSLNDGDVLFNSIKCDNYVRNNVDNIIFTFRRDFFQKFVNSYRKKFERLGFTSNFRYFCVGEYGTDERYTMRPHFHAILFLSQDIVNFYSSPFGFNENLFLEDVRKYWSYGMVHESKDYGLIVKSFKALRYCCKYICKSSALLRNRYFKRFYDFLDSNFNLITFFADRQSPIQLFHFLSRELGFNFRVLNSSGFGSSLYFRNRNLLYNFDKLYRFIQDGYSVPEDNCTHIYQYPKYILNKFCLDHRDDGSYYLTPFGYYYLEHNSFNSFLIFCKSLNFSNVDIYNLFHSLCNDLNIDDISGFTSYFNTVFYSKLSDVKFLERYFIYIRFYRDTYSLKSNFGFYDDLLDLDSVYSFDTLVNIALRSKFGYVFTDSDLSSVIDFDSPLYMNSHDFFENNSLYSNYIHLDFENFHKFLSSLRYFIGCSNENIKLKSDYIIKFCNDTLNLLSYGVS